MRDILTIYQVKERYFKGTYYESLKGNPIWLDDKVISLEEFELWLSQQVNSKEVRIETFPKIFFLNIRSNPYEE